MSSKSLTLVLKRTPAERSAEPSLYIEGVDSMQAMNPADFATKLRVFLDDMKNLKFLDHLDVKSSADLSSEENSRLERYRKVAADVVADIKRSLGEYEDSLLGIKNLFENISTILNKPDVSHIKIKKPFHAVVIAAGPSLELEYENLRKIQSKALLICVDASLKTLLRHQIEPDIVVAIERDDHSVPFFQNLPTDLKSLLVCHATVKKIIFESYPGPIATALKYTGPFLWLPFKRAHFWTASSSAHLAYRLAAELGASSIALVGQDLCFHPDTFQSHAEVTDYPDWAKASTEENRVQNKKASRAPGNTRAEVFTDPTWSLFARDYQVMVDEVKIPTTNTSQLGMKIGNIPFQPLNEWIEKSQLVQVLEIERPKENPDREADTRALSQKLLEARAALTNIHARLQDAKELEDPDSLYDRLPHTPHFLELVLEVVFTDWVKTENLCLNATIAEAKAYKTKFLHRASDAIKRVFEIIPSQVRL